MYGGRWNTAGTAVFYCSESRALAALEFLVHGADLSLLPPMILLEIDVPDDTLETLADSVLPPGWDSLVPAAATQELGDAWARRAESLVLQVPSVVMPEEHNLIVNASHPEIRAVDIVASRPFRFDLRLESASSSDRVRARSR
jgi:RES domain-containing protein